MQDGELGYQNIFYAILDAFYSALKKANGSSLKIVMSEIGWPSKGGQATTFEYAGLYNKNLYNKNLLRHVKGGTPKRPVGPIETYIVSMFNENKPTPAYQKIGGSFTRTKCLNTNLSFNKNSKPS